MPSAFIAATASPRALLACAIRTGNGSSRIDSTTDSTSSAKVSDSGSIRSNAACANDASGWLSAKSSCSAGASCSVRPYSSGSVEPLEHAGGQQLLAERRGLLGQPRAPALVLVVVLHQRAHRVDGVRRAG